MNRDFKLTPIEGAYCKYTAEASSFKLVEVSKEAIGGFMKAQSFLNQLEASWGKLQQRLRLLIAMEVP